MRVVDPTIDVAAVIDLLADQYGFDGGALEFVPVGADSWCFRAGPFWVSARRDRQGHVPEAYHAAAELAEHGNEFVLAPLRGRDGRVVHEAGRHPVVVSPFAEGTTLHAQLTGDVAAVSSVVELLHAASVDAPLPREDYRFPFRSELEEAVAIAARRDSAAGPFSKRVEDLVRAHRDYLDALAAEAGEIATACRRDTTPFVLTHLEPNGNTMRTTDGRVLLFDWGCLALGPPERDWWDFDRLPPGIVVRATFKRFYEVRWILGEVAEYIWRFVHPHSGDDDDLWMWDEMRKYFPS